MSSYYSTSHWKEFSERVKDQNPFCCQCGVGSDTARAERRPLQAHHLNYDSVGEESEEDVEVLCRECHKNEHGGRSFDEKNF